MANTHDFSNGRFFHVINLKPRTTLRHSAKTHELDPPFRVSDSKVYRIWPLNKAIVIGSWQHSGMDERQALFEATHIEGKDGAFGSGWDIRSEGETIQLGARSPDYVRFRAGSGSGPALTECGRYVGA